MIELVKIIKEIKEKYGVTVRFFIGLADNGETLILRDFIDATEDGNFTKWHPAEGGGCVNLFDCGEISFNANDKLKAFYNAIRLHYSEFFNGKHKEKIIEGSIGEWGFSDKTFLNHNLTIYESLKKVNKK